MTKTINYNKNGLSFGFNVKNNMFFNKVSPTEFLRWMKGIFGNKARFEARFLNDFIKSIEPLEWDISNLIEFMRENFDAIEPYSYKEGFEINDPQFRANVFGSIDIGEMINNLGAKRIKTDGMPVKHKQFSENGEFMGYKEYNVVYELYEVDGNKLDLHENIYAVKCWCTTTDKEHYLWVEDEYNNDPLEAIASTCRFYKSLMPYVKEIKRQGDVFLFEMTEKVKPEDGEEKVPLSKDEYFSLLTAQS